GDLPWIEHVGRHEEARLALGFALQRLVVDGHLGLHVPGLVVRWLAFGGPPFASIVGLALDGARDPQPGWQRLQLALQLGLRIGLTGECLIAEVPELALPLRAVALRPFGQRRPRARQTGVRDDHDPALAALGQCYLPAEPPGLSVGAPRPLVGFLA